MKNKDNISAEERYRQERKERLAKEAKKSKKQMTPKAKQTMSKVIGIVVCVALVLAAVAGLLSFLGVPQKLITVATVGDKKFSAAEYNYYYTAVFMNYANNTAQYDQQYGEGTGKSLTGFDATIAPDKQTKENEDGTKITFAEFFGKTALETMEQNAYYISKAKEKGITLTEEDLANVDDIIDQIEAQKSGNANMSGYSLNRYLAKNYGKGVNEKLVRQILKDQSIVDKYIEQYEDEISASVAESDILAKYEESKIDYLSVDAMLYAFVLTKEEDIVSQAEDAPEYTNEQQKARAEAMLAAVEDRASFMELCKQYCTDEEKESGVFDEENGALYVGMPYSEVKGNLDDEAATWIFSEERAEGDKRLIETDSYIYVFYIDKPAYRSEQIPVSARHILVKFADDTTPEDDLALTNEIVTDKALELANTVEEGTTEAESTEGSDGTTDLSTPALTKKSEYLKKAGTYLKEWLDGDKTESFFGELADKYSDDKASTSEYAAQTGGNGGGLFTNIKTGEYVKPFERWCLDEKREAGDYDIIETKYGYHIMYFVDKNDEPLWKSTIRSSLAEELMEKAADDIKAEYKDTLVVKKPASDWAYKTASKHVITSYFTKY